MKHYTKVSQIRKILPTLKQANGGPAKSGQMVQIKYEAFDGNRDGGLASQAARIAGMDLHIYTGFLDSVRNTPAPNPQMIVTLLALERLDPKTGGYRYTACNLSKGRCRFLKVL